MFRLRTVGLVGVGAVLGFSALLFWASGGLQSAERFDGRILSTQAPSDSRAPSPDTLRIVSWNIAFARGNRQPHRDSWQRPDASTVRNHLDRIADVLRHHRVDVALLQEVDFDSDRSGRVDQLRYLLDETHFIHAARALTWSANYVPFPLWTPSEHYGRVRSGGVVLSTLPIEQNRVHLQSKPASRNWLIRRFYLSQYSQFVQLRIGDGSFTVVNNHLDALHPRNRRRQAEHLTELLARRDRRTEAPILVLGGDFNSTPPDPRTPTDPPGIRRRALRQIVEYSPTLRPSIDWFSTARHPRRYATFHGLEPLRKLDHVVVSTRHVLLRSSEVLDVRAPSDHRPLLTTLELR